MRLGIESCPSGVLKRPRWAGTPQADAQQGGGDDFLKRRQKWACHELSEEHSARGGYRFIWAHWDPLPRVDQVQRAFVPHSNRLSSVRSRFKRSSSSDPTLTPGRHHYLGAGFRVREGVVVGERQSEVSANIFELRRVNAPHVPRQSHGAAERDSRSGHLGGLTAGFENRAVKRRIVCGHELNAVDERPNLPPNRSELWSRASVIPPDAVEP